MKRSNLEAALRQKNDFFFSVPFLCLVFCFVGYALDNLNTLCVMGCNCILSALSWYSYVLSIFAI
jgi:hypothetical protein